MSGAPALVCLILAGTAAGFSAGRTFTLSWSELKDWVGVRAQAGRIAPKGFPRSNSFGPAF